MAPAPKFIGVLPVKAIGARQVLPKVVANDPNPPGTNKAYRGSFAIPPSTQPKK